MHFEFRLPIIWKLHLHQQGCEELWFFFEAKGDQRANNLGNTGTDDI
jgi:hypothetical protein